MLKNARIVITKSRRRLDVFDGQTLVRSFIVVVGSTPCGDKEAEGDGRTPEGEFYICTKNPESKFHLSLGISYPNIAAAERGLITALITSEEYDQIVSAINEKRAPLQKTALGGEIYIHGGGLEGDWTEGCIALENSAIEELFAAVTVGAAILITP
ncbi:MAG: L,D-transpeptidase family protein [Pyrinomonadaceae bacterium]